MKRIHYILIIGLGLLLSAHAWAQVVVSQPVNTNYTDTGSALFTYVQGNEIDVAKNSPSVTLQKWGGEEKLGISVAQINSPTAVVGTSTMVSNSLGGGETVQMQPTADGQGFDVDIKLASKPAINVFTYTFSGYQDMAFYYQAPLWQEAGYTQATTTCTDTDCTTSEGTSHRPTNIVGSYAVYSQSHVNHILGQTNYQTGKLFQIYRPQVTDNNGSTTWATLSYNNGVLSIAVPQSFLDNAAYPVVIDPTFGYTTVGGSTSNPSTGYAFRSVNTYTGISGTQFKASIYASTTTANLAVGIYNGNTLITNTASFSGVGSPQWFSSLYKAATIGNSAYELAYESNAGTATTNIYYDTNASNNYQFISTAFGSWPSGSGWSNGSGDFQYSIYITSIAPLRLSIPTGRLSIVPNNTTISLDASAFGGRFNSVQSGSWSYTVSGTNPLLAVCIQIRGSNETGSSVTWGSQNLTFVNRSLQQGGGGNLTTELWYLAAPNTGTATVTVNLNDAFATNFEVASASFDGVSKVSPLDTSAVGNGGAGVSSLSATLTPSSSNNVVISCATDNNFNSYNTFTFSSTNGTATIDQNPSGVFTFGMGHVLGSSGSNNYTWGNSDALVVGTVAGSFKPAFITRLDIPGN